MPEASRNGGDGTAATGVDLSLRKSLRSAMWPLGTLRNSTVTSRPMIFFFFCPMIFLTKMPGRWRAGSAHHPSPRALKWRQNQG